MNNQSLLYLQPRGTFYDSKSDVIKSNENLHEELFLEDRELYTYLLYFNNAKYYSKQLMLNNLLKNSLYKEFPVNNELIKIEDYLIYRALMNENITHSLKMLESLKENKINNSRTSKIILRFLFDRGNLDYISVKYKSKVKDLLIHALGLISVNKILSGDMSIFDKKIGIYKNPYALETINFVFNKDFSFKSEYFITYNKAKEIILNGKPLKIKKNILPIEVLEGFVSSSKNKYYNLDSIYEVANLSEKQKVQKVKVLKDKGVKEDVVKQIDYSKLSNIDLLKLVYNGELDDESLSIVNNEIEKKVNSKRLEFGDVNDIAFIFDASLSLSGSNDNKLSAFYKGIELLQYFRSDNIYYCGGKIDEGRVYPSGDTNISSSFLNAVKDGFRNIVIMSDGFENVGEIDTVYNKLKDLNIDVKVTHLNPVFSPKNMEFKKLSYDFTTIPYENLDDFLDRELFELLNNDAESFKNKMREIISKEISL